MYPVRNKPINPVINWANPVTRGLVFDCSMHEKSGTTTKERVLNNTGTILSGTTWTKNLYGIGMDFTTSTSRIDFTTQSIQNSEYKISMEALIYRDNTAGVSVFTKTNSGGTISRWRLSHDTGQNCFSFGMSGWSNNPGWGSPNGSFAINTWYHIVLTHDGINNISATPTFYVNGNMLSGYSFSVPPTGSYSDPGDGYVKIGCNRLGTGMYDGRIMYLRYWNRVISHKEVHQLYQNPWNIYNMSQPVYANSVSTTAILSAYRRMMGIGR